MLPERESEKDSVVRAVAEAPAGTPFLPTGGGFSKKNGSSEPPTGSDSAVVSGGLTLAGAEGLGVGWTVAALVTRAALEAGAVAVAVATGAGDCSAWASAVPVAGTEAKARTNAANNAVFIRKEFTFIFHETAAQPTCRLNGRKRPK
jgi:hypothetical protein